MFHQWMSNCLPVSWLFDFTLKNNNNKKRTTGAFEKWFINYTLSTRWVIFVVRRKQIIIHFCETIRIRKILQLICKFIHRTISRLSVLCTPTGIQLLEILEWHFWWTFVFFLLSFAILHSHHPVATTINNFRTILIIIAPWLPLIHQHWFVLINLTNEYEIRVNWLHFFESIFVSLFFCYLLFVSVKKQI